MQHRYPTDGAARSGAAVQQLWWRGQSRIQEFWCGGMWSNLFIILNAQESLQFTGQWLNMGTSRMGKVWGVGAKGGATWIDSKLGRALVVEALCPLLLPVQPFAQWTALGEAKGRRPCSLGAP